jgi:hypothetical protein
LLVRSSSNGKAAASGRKRGRNNHDDDEVNHLIAEPTRQSKRIRSIPNGNMSKGNGNGSGTAPAKRAVARKSGKAVVVASSSDDDNDDGNDSDNDKKDNALSSSRYGWMDAYRYAVNELTTSKLFLASCDAIAEAYFKSPTRWSEGWYNW